MPRLDQQTTYAECADHGLVFQGQRRAAPPVEELPEGPLRLLWHRTRREPVPRTTGEIVRPFGLPKPVVVRAMQGLVDAGLARRDTIHHHVVAWEMTEAGAAAYAGESAQ